MSETEVDNLSTAESPKEFLSEWRWLWFVLAAFLVSLFLAYAGAYFLGDHVGPGGMYPEEGAFEHILYRCDSEYYQDIAETGYRYDGDLRSTPNIVFAPVYSLEIRLLSAVTPLGYVNAGFWVSRLDFLAALILLFLVIREWFGERAAIFTTLGLCFSAGSWAFHAYYSESTMLAWLAASFFCLQRRWYLPLAAASFVLSATRTTAGPFCLVLAVWFLVCAWQEYRRPDRNWRRIAQHIVCAPLCLGGLCLFLGYLWYHFGNPFILLPKIQAASWEYFHQPVAWWEVAVLKHMFVHGAALLQLGRSALTDIRSINYVYTLLAIVAATYGMFRFKQRAFKWGFAGYVLLIYKMNAGTGFLISTHRFFAMMVPLFLMASDLHGWLEAKTNRYLATTVSVSILLLSATYYVVCLTHFVMGHWYYF